jgi:hypothetical protein
MARLAALDVARLPQELGPSAPGAPDPDEVARIAASLADSAARIPQALGGVALEPEEREVFLSLARRLQQESHVLRGHAVHGRRAGTEASLREINTTCAACHALFRP